MDDKTKVVKRLLNDWDCKRHKSDEPCKECYSESEAEYYRAQAEYEEEQKAKEAMEEQEEHDREQEWLSSLEQP